MDRRTFVIGSAASIAALRLDEAIAQESFPARPITIVNAFPPGGANDLVTRPIAAALEAVFKQPVVVETKAGAAGAVGAQFVASAKPDGYTLLSHNNGLSSYAEVDRLFGRPPKTTRADFIPLARLVADPVLLVVNEQQPYKTLEDFVAEAKKRPGQIVYSSGGLYGASHLPVAMLEKAARLCRKCAICRPAVAGRRSRRCSATTRRPARRRCWQRSSTSRRASCVRWHASARSDRRFCPMCRP